MINWKVRLKNPVWWAHAIEAALIPLIIGVGLQWSDMTSWATLGETIMTALGNPVVVVAAIVSVWNTIIDPTTKGLSDSKQAMTYDKPKEL